MPAKKKPSKKTTKKVSKKVEKKAPKKVAKKATKKVAKKKVDKRKIPKFGNSKVAEDIIFGGSTGATVELDLLPENIRDKELRELWQTAWDAINKINIYLAEEIKKAEREF